jgi:SAM-dependent methyltransferase
MDPMNHPSESKPRGRHGQYDAYYGNFGTDLYEQIRRETYGEDIGQNSWLTTDEQDRFIAWLDLAPGRMVLDVACGAGGPALRIAERSGCAIIGVDVHEQAIANAASLAVRRGLSQRATFRVADAARGLPFPDGGFGAVTCIDAINHLPDRPAVVREWARLLKPGGRMLFTDPITVTGPLTNAEIARRSSTGFYLFVPREYDEEIIAACGLRLVVSENVTSNMADIAGRRHAARASREAALRKVEGDTVFDEQQEFLETTARIAREGRLSRFVYVAEKPR